MKGTTAAAFALALAFAPPQAEAGDDGVRRALASVIIEESGGDQMARRMISAMLPALRGQLETAAAAEGRRLNLARVAELEAEMELRFTDLMRVMRPDFVEAMTEVYTLEELELLLELQRRPEMISLMEKYPLYMERVGPETARRAQEMAMRTVQEFGPDTLFEPGGTE